MGRTQSPSSINMYKQCPRKYYYRYIERLPTKPSIHLVRGVVAHEVLEFFFASPPKQTPPDWRTDLQLRVLALLEKTWLQHNDEFSQLDLTPQELLAYKEETRHMIINWINYFTALLEKRLSNGQGFVDAFLELTPEREIKYHSEELKVLGYIDAVENHDNIVTLMDYKTSKKPIITKEYRLQLGIYALLYHRRHQKLPDYVGIHFLRHDRQVMEVNDELLLDAQFEIEQVHMLTQSKSIVDYPKNITPLCNWCDFYQTCFSTKKTLTQQTLGF